MTNDINVQLSNARKDIKAKIQSIATSLNTIKEEQEHIKDITKELKESHDIKPKDARFVAKLVNDPDMARKFTEDYERRKELKEQITL